MDVRFASAKLEDLGMLREWIATPHWQEWWTDPDDEVSYIRDMIEDRDTTRPFVFHLDSRPTGYIQYWFIGHHQNADWITRHPWLADLPEDAIGVDLSIAEPDQLSKGIGSTVLRAFAARLVADGWRTIIIDPDPTNARAIRAYEKAGFAAVPELLGKTSDCLSHAL